LLAYAFRVDFSIISLALGIPTQSNLEMSGGMIRSDSSGSPVLPIELPNHQAAAILFSKHFMIYNACSHSGLDKAVTLVPGGEIRFISKQEPVVSLVLS